LNEESLCAEQECLQGFLVRTAMTTLEAFFLGFMAAWTPSLVLLAWLLWRDAGSQNQPSGLQQ
jgi:hypothetical protein